MAQIKIVIENEMEDGSCDVAIGIDMVTPTQLLIMMASLVQDASQTMGLSERLILNGIEQAVQMQNKGKQDG